MERGSSASKNPPRRSPTPMGCSPSHGFKLSQFFQGFTDTFPDGADPSHIRITALVDLDPQGSATAWSGLRASETPVVVPGSAPQLPALLAAARSAGADLCIIDTAPHSTGAALKAAQAADLVLIPCRASVADLHAIGTSIEISRTARTAAVVLNAAPVQGPLVSQAQAAIAGYEVDMVPVVLHQRIAHVHAFTNGLTAPELARSSKAGTELAALFD